MSNYVERSRRGLGSRIKNSVGGVIFGIVLLLLGTVAIFLNESRAVKRAKDLKEGRGQVVSVEAAKVDPANEGKLVHFSGETKTGAPISDSQFGISGDYIRINRKAEMYQWVEEVSSKDKKNVGGSVDTEKTYSYTKAWKNSPVDSTKFKVNNGHSNPTKMPFRDLAVEAKTVTLGAFTLPDFLVSRINNGTSSALTSLEKAVTEVKNAGQISDGGVYIGSDPLNPAIGDIRVKFNVVKPGPTSVVGKQQGSTLAKFPTKTGGTIEILHVGIHDAGQMFDTEVKNNTVLTWILRGAAFAMLVLGFNLILGPLSVMADVLPFLGNLVSKGTGVIAFLLAALVWTIVVGISWLIVRPLIGGALLALTVVTIVLIVKRMKQGKAEAGPPPMQEEPPSMTPPPLN